MADPDIGLEGMKKLQRQLRKIDPALVKEFRTSMKPMADKVAASARSKVSTRTIERKIRITKSGREDRRYKKGSTETGGARGSIKAGVSAKGPFVQGGGSSVPYYGWLDFGSRNPNIGAPRSVGPWHRSGAGPKRGRFIYPAIDDNRSDLEEEAAQLVERIAQKTLPHD